MPLLSHHDPTQLGFNDHYCIEIMHTNIIRKLLLATVFNTRTPYLVSPPPVYSPHFLDSYFLNRDSTNWIPKKWQMVSHHPQKKKKKSPNFWVWLLSKVLHSLPQTRLLALSQHHELVALSGALCIFIASVAFLSGFVRMPFPRVSSFWNLILKNQL